MNYADYARNLRHELHQIPELGFDLPKTTAVVKRELDAMGVTYTEKYGKGSIVVYLGKPDGFTVALRADMDALPLPEESNNPFPSQHPGVMHACGHDVHTAQMLAVTKKLHSIEDQLRCRVKIIFQPAEEYITPGMKMLVENGIAEDIDCAVACHVNGTRDVGKVYFHSGPSNSNSMGILCEFFGRSAHAHSQQMGVDAIRMAIQAWHSMEIMAAREIPSKECFVFNVGQIQGGNTNNIVCDYCKLFISARAWTDELSDFMERRVRQICESVAQMCGGEAKVTVTKLIPYMDNNPILVEKLRQSAERTLGKGNVGEYARGMGAEDFSFISRKKPAVMISMGTGCDNNPDTRRPVHNNHFDADERCFDTGIEMFVNFILDLQDGISFQ